MCKICYTGCQHKSSSPVGRVPTHPERPGERIHFQAWKSSGKKKIMKMSQKNPGNFLKIHMKLGISIFLKDLYP